MSIFKNISISPLDLEFRYVGFFDARNNIAMQNSYDVKLWFYTSIFRQKIHSFKVNGRN